MFTAITASIRLSEMNESCLAAANSALQLLAAISSLKFLFTVSSKDRKIHAKKETMRQSKNEPSKKKILSERKRERESKLFKYLDSLFWTLRGWLPALRLPVLILTRLSLLKLFLLLYLYRSNATTYPAFSQKLKVHLRSYIKIFKFFDGLKQR